MQTGSFFFHLCFGLNRGFQRSVTIEGRLQLKVDACQATAARQATGSPGRFLEGGTGP